LAKTPRRSSATKRASKRKTGMTTNAGQGNPLGAAIVVGLIALVAAWYVGVREESTGDGGARNAHAEIDAVLDQLRPANIVFNPPARMTFGEVVTVGALVSLTMTPEELAEEIQKRLPIDRRIEGAEIKVAPVIDVNLSADHEAFEINAIVPVRQPLGQAAPSEWRWIIRAKSGGLHHLHLTVDAVLLLNDREVPKLIRTFDRPVEVEVTIPQRVRQFVTPNWQWLWGIAVIPIYRYVRKRWKPRKDPKGSLSAE
jgi:hypothetical protein